MGSNVPWWLPLSVLVWAVQMAVFHGVGLFFEWSDRRGMLASFKVRDNDRLGYFELLPRVLFNQIFVLLPAMVAFQYTGLAFTGAPRLSVWHFLAGLVLMGIGHDIVQYVFHRFVLHRPGLIRKLGHSVHHSTGASKAISACYMSLGGFLPGDCPAISRSAYACRSGRRWSVSPDGRESRRDRGPLRTFGIRFRGPPASAQSVRFWAATAGLALPSGDQQSAWRASSPEQCQLQRWVRLSRHLRHDF